jgi:hypothetical protein
MNNPLRELMKKSEKIIHPITVKCVVDDLSKISKDIQDIRDYCHDLNIVFITREFDSAKYSDDRYRIERLPAFHIYVNKCYNKTFYPNTRPYQIIEEIVEKYIKRLEEDENNKKEISNFFSKTVNSIKKFVGQDSTVKRLT